MLRILEAVPNLSEGRQPEKIGQLAGELAASDVDVLDWSADPHHNRAVLTYIGEPEDVERASLVVARWALEHIDLAAHRGVHPRVGALDVMPFVALEGLSMDDAVDSAHRVGQGIAALGVPVYFYGFASSPPGRGLADIRRGGFEALRAGFPEGRQPDLPPGAVAPHATAGATCVGARGVLLAWNVFVRGIDLPAARAIASVIRERGGGFMGLRALGVQLGEGGDRIQISMNLEEPARVAPSEILAAIEREAALRGGTVEETEVIGMIPDTLVLPAAGGRLDLPDLGPARVLSRRVAEYVSRRARGSTEISDTTA